MKTSAIRFFLLGCIPTLLLYSPVSAKADTEGPYTYTVADGFATITDFSSNYVGILTITNELGGYPVTIIGNSAFAFCSRLTSVTIADSVTSIGREAFSFCTNLFNVMIGHGVTNIGYQAFFYCPNLSYASIPENVISIDEYAFHSCACLTNITIPASITSIGVGAYGNCSGLTNISVNTTNSAYSSSNGILFNKSESILIQYPGGKTGPYDIPINVTSIGTYAFAQCPGLTDVTIPDSVTSIGYGAFLCCSGLTNVVLGNHVDTLSQMAFAYCSSLPSVSIPDSVTNIVSDTFEYCSALEHVTIGSNVTYVGYETFRSCGALQRIYFTGNAPEHGGSVFFDSDAVTIYYLPGTTGWGSAFSDRPTLLWDPTLTSVTIAGSNVSCSVTGTPSIPVALEKNTNLLSDMWLRLYETNITDGAVTLHDTNEMNGLVIFYRIVGP